ncbi:MAG: UDP-glucose 6-dehydrogenase, partial [Saprospiraceae bacterium]|nr:UDP-glucose 6-dehydrogenase [Saprospiraceae bacterium]
HRYFGGRLEGKKIAVWGLAFKPNTDDIREAPALTIIRSLLEMGASIQVYDPEAMANVKKILGESISYAENEYEALQGADALAIVTEWTVFRNPDFDQMKSLMHAPVIFDGRNVYDVAEMEALGFVYDSIGRKSTAS